MLFLFSFFFVKNSVAMIISTCICRFTLSKENCTPPTVHRYSCSSILLPTLRVIYLFHLSSLYKNWHYIFVFNWMKFNIFFYIHCLFLSLWYKIGLYLVFSEGQIFTGMGFVSEPFMCFLKLFSDNTNCLLSLICARSPNTVL